MGFAVVTVELHFKPHSEPLELAFALSLLAFLHS